jgi:hypothetical protein
VACRPCRIGIGVPDTAVAGPAAQLPPLFLADRVGVPVVVRGVHRLPGPRRPGTTSLAVLLRCRVRPGWCHARRRPPPVMLSARTCRPGASLPGGPPGSRNLRACPAVSAAEPGFRRVQPRTGTITTPAQARRALRLDLPGPGRGHPPRPRPGPAPARRRPAGPGPRRRHRARPGQPAASQRPGDGTAARRRCPRLTSRGRRNLGEHQRGGAPGGPRRLPEAQPGDVRVRVPSSFPSARCRGCDCGPPPAQGPGATARRPARGCAGGERCRP